MLETYPQENMNTQAIRELTDEVFNLKQKQETAQATMQSEINTLTEEVVTINDKLYIIKTAQLSDFTREINSLATTSVEYSFSSFQPEGYRLLSYFIRYLDPARGVIIPFAFSISNALTSLVNFCLFNSSNNAASVSSGYATLIYEKITE